MGTGAIGVLSSSVRQAMSRKPPSIVPNQSTQIQLRRIVTRPDRNTWKRPCYPKRHFKEGEFPAITLDPSQRTRNPVKNIKKKLDKKAKSKAWVPTVTETLSESIEKKKFKEALEVFEMLRRQPFYHPTEGTYMKLIILMGRSAQPEIARHLFDQMLLENLLPTAPLYTALLAAYTRNSLVLHAFEVLEEMKLKPHCQPDIFTYTTLLKGLVDTKEFNLIPKVYDEMSQREIVPNTVTQNTVLGGYGKAEMYEQMQDILSGMVSGDTAKPDSWTMNIILSVYGNKGNIQMMEKWYEKFRDFGVEPDIRTFNILIGCYGSQRMYDKMSSVMEYMRKSGFAWNISTYNNVIEALAEVGDAKHIDYTFYQMRSEGLRPDIKTLSCLAKGYGNAGLFHKVIASVELASKYEILPNTNFCNAMISACVMAGDLMEMERVFDRMKRSSCAPDSSTFEVMIRAYRKEGMNDKVYDLEREMLKIGLVLPAVSISSYSV